MKRDLIAVTRPMELVWIGADNPVKKEEGVSHVFAHQQRRQLDLT